MSDEAVSAGVDMTDAMDTAKRSFQAIGASIGAELMPVVNDMLQWVIAHMPEIQETIGKAVDFVGNAFHFIGELWTGFLEPIFTGIIEFLDGVFTGDWEKIWQGLVDFVSGVFKGLVNVLRTPINWIIGGLNTLIDGYNKVKDKIPLSGSLLYDIPNIPEIPALAKGGNITGEGTVLVGEAGPELLRLPVGASVTPLTGSDKASTEIDYDRLADAIVSAFNGSFEAVSDTGLYRIVQNESRRNTALGWAGAYCCI